MSYTDALAAATPAQGRTDRGIVVVLVRIAEHLGYLVAHIEDRIGAEPNEQEKERNITHDRAELTDIVHHGDTLLLGQDSVSAAANGHLMRFRLLLSHVQEDWENLEDEQRKERLADVSNRLAYAAAFLDVELAGLAASAGSNA